VVGQPVIAPVDNERAPSGDERRPRAAARGDATLSTSPQSGAPPPPLEKDSTRAASAAPCIAYLSFGAALTCLFYLFPAYASPLWTALGLSSVAATVVGVRLNQPRQPLAWYLLAAATLCFIAGNSWYNVLSQSTAQSMAQNNPFPSLADLFYLFTYPLLAAGIFVIIRARSSSRDVPALIDAAIMTTGLGLLLWVYLVVPVFQTNGLDALPRITSVAYPLGDILILAMLARLVAGGGLRIGSMQLLVIGAVGLMVASVLCRLIQLNGSWKVGGPVDSGWAVFYVAWGAAALHPSMRRLTDVVPVPSVAVSQVRITLLLLTSLIAPGVLFMQSQMHGEIPATTVAVFSAALFLLVLARMAGILAAHQQSVRRERALRTSSEALAAAQGLPEIYDVALASVTSLIGAAALKDASVYLTDSEGIHCLASSATSDKVRDEGALWDAARGGGCLRQAGTVSVHRLRYGLQERGMLITEAKAALTVDQHHALATLASQVALAVASATLAEELRQRRSQEQFRGIIQNASDIVMVVDELGCIKYGTPSLERGLGHRVSELLGTPVADLLPPDESAIAGALISGMAGRSSQAQSVSDWRLRRADGRYVLFDVVASNLLDDSSVAGIVLTMRDVSERRALEVQLMHQAFHDTLTDLPNRALFQDRVDHALARAAREGTEVAMAMLDLDDFKVVNDTRGHAAGDAMLREVAHRLKTTLRASTTIARLGGDEFAVLIEDLNDKSRISGLIERIMRPFRTPFVVQGDEVSVTASIGVVRSGGSEDALDFAELLRCADLALYAAKERGKGRAELYSDDLHIRMLSRATHRAELSKALENEQFELCYQPIVLIDTGEIVGSETLLRWRHPTRGLVMPDDFITTAEETGQIVELGRWVLDHACAQWRAWADLGHTRHRLSVNVSVRQLQEPGFVDEVRSVLLRHSMAPAALVLEVTESVLALDESAIRGRLTLLRRMGVQIAVDDFGKGYSSLSFLQQFQIDEVKIDKSFVDGLGSGNLDEGALANAIVSMSHSLRLQVVAEGIERVAQRDELWSMGCRLGQGRLYSKPVPPEELLDLLNRADKLGNELAVPGGPNTARLRIPVPVVRLPQGSGDVRVYPEPEALPRAGHSTLG
jgi:diguanylate cyclase (GGDEF)-like protein/PAS domain S-box-containing protein